MPKEVIPPRPHQQQHCPCSLSTDYISYPTVFSVTFRLFSGVTNSYTGDTYRPSFIQDNELRHLILKVSEEIYLSKSYLPFIFI